MSINSLSKSLPSNNPNPDGFSALSRYIPTESITLYVAAVSASPALSSTFPSWNPVYAYYFLAFLTPVLLLLLFLGKNRILNKDLWKQPRSWPWWYMVASTIAFCAWSLAVPQNGVIPDTETSRVLGAFAALVVSTLLSTAAPFFEYKEKISG